jgi:hypothetical protein
MAQQLPRRNAHGARRTMPKAAIQSHMAQSSRDQVAAGGRRAKSSRENIRRVAKLRVLVVAPSMSYSPKVLGCTLTCVVPKQERTDAGFARGLVRNSPLCLSGNAHLHFDHNYVIEDVHQGPLA